MTPQHHLPADIERTSLSIITAELAELGLTPPPETAAVVKRVIHTTADFDYATSTLAVASQFRINSRLNVDFE